MGAPVSWVALGALVAMIGTAHAFLHVPAGVRGPGGLQSHPFRRLDHAPRLARRGLAATRATAVGEYIDAVESPVQGVKDLGDHGAYDWKKQWYPVQFDKNIEGGQREPYSVSIFDVPLVLYRDNSGQIVCLQDLCPHRAAKLSEGQVTPEGTIECLYHGWQFEGGGVCTKIPQLASGAQIPKRACVKTYPVAVREGMVYVFMGGLEASKTVPVPVSAQDLDKSEGFMVNSFVCELPYDASYLAENLIDPAHIPVSHDATEGGGKKENATPYVMEVAESDVKGIRGRFREEKKDIWTDLSFESPCIIRYRTEARGFVFGAALHCLPLGQGKSRLMFRTFFKANWLIHTIFKLKKPMWARHLNSNKILEQDVGLITSQEDYVRNEGVELQDAFLPLRTSDTFVVEFRKWLDKVGHGMPNYVGWKTSKYLPETLSSSPLTTLVGAQHRSKASRYFRSVIHNKETRDALRNIKLIIKAATYASALALSAALLLLGKLALTPPVVVKGVAKHALVFGAPASQPLCWSMALGLGAFLVRAVLLSIQRSFYVNFERHPAP